MPLLGGQVLSLPQWLQQEAAADPALMMGFVVSCMAGEPGAGGECGKVVAAGLDGATPYMSAVQAAVQARRVGQPVIVSPHGKCINPWCVDTAVQKCTPTLTFPHPPHPLPPLPAHFSPWSPSAAVAIHL